VKETKAFLFTVADKRFQLVCSSFTRKKKAKRRRAYCGSNDKATNCRQSAYNTHTDTHTFIHTLNKTNKVVTEMLAIEYRTQPYVARKKNPSGRPYCQIKI